jgi:hypothetical protein
MTFIRPEASAALNIKKLIESSVPHASGLVLRQFKHENDPAIEIMDKSAICD